VDFSKRRVAPRHDPGFGQDRAADAVRAALGTSAVRHVYVSSDDSAGRLPVALDLVRRATGSPTDETVTLATDVSREGLLGWIEAPAEAGASPSVRHGALLRAERGVLVVEVDVLSRSDDPWLEFRRALRDGTVLLRPRAGRAGTPSRTPASALVPVAARVVLVGEEETYARLFDEDRGFRDVVPVKATLESRMRATTPAIRAFAGFFEDLADRERLRPLAPSAFAALVEDSAREVGRQGWLSLRFPRAAERLREADLVAGDRGSRRVEARDVLEARRRAAARLGVHERRAFEAVLEGVVLIDTRGRVVGQVNGLAVHDYGNLGSVARITATVGPGREGIVNVEREVALSGASYDKGVHILAGYLTEALACRRTAALAVRIVFEQSYGHLTGDSATCAEACAVLSALARAPLRQDIAITGSMDQHGEVQAIGGVNEKVEAFFDLCAARGLTGTQGVVIPAANADDLMLRPDVVAACASGRFRVHAIARIEEGLGLLAGLPAGRTAVAGRFRPGSVFDLASRRMADLSA
jgi:predicted ATP-dependent protease